MTVTELEDFFNSVTVPETLVIDKGTKIVDVKFFIKSQLRVLRAHPESKASIPFYDRLINLKELISRTNL